MEIASVALAAASPFMKALLSPIFDGTFKKWSKTVHLGDEVDNLQKKLQFIKTVLWEADEAKLDNPQFRESLIDLKLVASHANDLLLELNHFRIRDTVENKLDYQIQVRAPASIVRIFIRDKLYAFKSTFSCASVRSVLPLPFEHAPLTPVPKLVRVDMSKRINGVVTELQRIGEDVQAALKLKTPSLVGEGDKGPHLNVPGKSSLVDESKVFGRVEEKHRIVQLLTCHNPVGKSVVTLPIVGHGGIGKSTLAQLVYNESRVVTHFDQRIWLRVSSTLNVEKLTLEMLDYISDGSCHEMKSLNRMQEILEGALKSKKVLLVVDNLSRDVSSKQWETLLDPFRRSSTKILVTTRYRSIAEKIGTIGPIKLDGLKGAELWDLFKSRVFGDESLDDYPLLRDPGKAIMNKLKGYPLEVETMCAVLREDLRCEHWNEVLESDEWKKPKETANPDEHIMSSLEISVRYLPRSPGYDLQKCFSFCSLFPKNEMLRGDDLLSCWVALDFIYSTHHGGRNEVLGIKALKDLVGRGFLQEVKQTNSRQPKTSHYVMHELMHDLAKMVSSVEFLTIDGSDVVGEPNRSVRHVSIITHSSYNPDNSTIDESFVRKLEEGVKILEISNLRTLMLIGRYDENLAKTIQTLFRNTKYLRIIRLSMESYEVDHLLPNISNSLVLRYLKLESGYLNPSSGDQGIALRPLSRLYQLEILDILDWHRVCRFQGCRLVSLQRIRAKGTQVAMIGEVGKPESVEELWEFTVQRKPGFDIGQLGEFKNLRGSLRISNIENIDSKEEAAKAKLVEKEQLRDLSLHCSTSRPGIRPDTYVNVFEGFRPPPTVRNLEICGYGGTTFPLWMERNCLQYVRSLKLTSCGNLNALSCLGQFRFLEKLHIEGMPSVKEITREFYGSSDAFATAFNKLSEMEISNMESCEKWLGVDDGCLIFSSLKKLVIRKCPVLSELPRQLLSFLSPLTELVVEGCEKLVLPALPPTDTLRTISISGGLDAFRSLSLSSPSAGELSLSVEWNPQTKTHIRDVLDFSNLKDLTELNIKGCPIDCLPWEVFQELVLLKRLRISDSDYGACSSGVIWLLPRSLELLDICSKCVTGKQLSEWLLHLPSLKTLVVNLSHITCLAVEDGPTASKASSPFDEGLLQIFSHSLGQLQELELHGCERLYILTLTQQGFRGFTSLKKLTIDTDSALVWSLWMNEELAGISLFPPSLINLHVNSMPGNLPSQSLSNLTSLKIIKLDSIPSLESLKIGIFISLEELDIKKCKDLSNLEGVLSLTSLGKLEIIKCGGVAAALEAALRSEKCVLRSFSLPLRVLVTDDTSFLTTKICKHMACLEVLVFVSVKRQEQQTREWTVEQRQALITLASIRQIEFRDCLSLKSLPDGLCSLQCPTTLKISNCPQITSLPGNGDGLVLVELHVDHCSEELTQQCKTLTSVTKSYIS